MTPRRQEGQTDSGIHSISAVTLAISDMARSMRFYQALGFTLRCGGEQASFTSLAVSPKLLGHSSVQTAAIYAHVVPRGPGQGGGEGASPREDAEESRAR